MLYQREDQSWNYKSTQQETHEPATECCLLLNKLIRITLRILSRLEKIPCRWQEGSALWGMQPPLWHSSVLVPNLLGCTVLGWVLCFKYITESMGYNSAFIHAQLIIVRQYSSLVAGLRLFYFFFAVAQQVNICTYRCVTFSDESIPAFKPQKNTRQSPCLESFPPQTFPWALRGAGLTPEPWPQVLSDLLFTAGRTSTIAWPIQNFQLTRSADVQHSFLLRLCSLTTFRTGSGDATGAHCREVIGKVCSYCWVSSNCVKPHPQPGILPHDATHECNRRNPSGPCPVAVRYALCSPTHTLHLWTVQLERCQGITKHQKNN